MNYRQTGTQTEHATAPLPRVLNWGVFSLCQLLVGLLLVSKFFAPTQQLWWDLDEFVFSVLNAGLAEHPTWQAMLALLNHRSMDFIMLAYFVAIYFTFVLRCPAAARARYLAGGVLMALWTIFTLDLSSQWIFSFDHPSPTLIVADAVRLSELVTWVNFKDASGESFPGDHGIALGMLTVFIWFYAGRRYGLWALGGALLFVLPRLLVGAHWFSDIALGSTAVVLFSLSIVLATPLHLLLTQCVSLPAEWLARLLEMINIERLIRVRAVGIENGNARQF